MPIGTVSPGSPAEAAGIKPGDILTTLDGRWTTSVADAYAAAEHVRPGQPVEAVVRRDGEEIALRIVPADGI